MRNFSKTLISMAAVMAVGSAMAAGAMAADLTIGQDTLKTDGKISISGVTTTDSKGNALTQYTLLVVKGTEGEKGVEYIISDGSAQGTTCTIKQIDQDDTGKAFTEAVLGTDLEDGSYKVMVGNNDGTVQSAIFEVSSKPQVEKDTILVGDVDASMDGEINSTDVGNILRAANGYTNRIGKCGTPRTLYDGTGSVKIGDVDASMDGEINSTDVGNILRAANGYTNRIGKCGTPIDVVKE